QYCTSGLKMGEMLPEVESGVDVLATIVLLWLEIGSGLTKFHATEARNALIKITAIGMIVKPDKQPLPSSYGVAAVGSYSVVVRARGIVYSLFLVCSGPGSK